MYNIYIQGEQLFNYYFTRVYYSHLEIILYIVVRQSAQINKTASISTSTIITIIVCNKNDIIIT